MFYQRDFDINMMECNLIIIESETYKSDSPKTHHSFKLFGDDIDNIIPFDFEIDKILSTLYEFELRTNLPENRLIYSTEWNNTTTDWIDFAVISSYTNSTLEKKQESLTLDYNFNYITIDQPIVHTKDISIHLQDIEFTYDIAFDDKFGYTKRINGLKVNYHMHNWLGHVKTHRLGVTGDVLKDSIPHHISTAVSKLTTHDIAKSSFSVLWLYRYYTGDIFIINVEMKNDVAKSIRFQYYIVAHLHIVNNHCGRCHDDCIHNWSDADIEIFKNFITFQSVNFKVDWYAKSSVINYKSKPIIVQNGDCCFIDKTLIDYKC